MRSVEKAKLYCLNVPVKIAVWDRMTNTLAHELEETVVLPLTRADIQDLEALVNAGAGSYEAFILQAVRRELHRAVLDSCESGDSDIWYKVSLSGRLTWG